MPRSRFGTNQSSNQHASSRIITTVNCGRGTRVDTGRPFTFGTRIAEQPAAPNRLSRRIRSSAAATTHFHDRRNAAVRFVFEAYQGALRCRVRATSRGSSASGPKAVN